MYAEKKIPNDQDYFYRVIERARTSTNSVIYGGSNTIIAREALDKVGGFYTESITEDFATGMNIESAGFVSLGLSEPLASGLAASDFREHIQQRTRWGRGVIVTGRKLKILRNHKLTMAQRFSYIGSVSYWYSPVKNAIFVLSPLMFAVLGIPVINCRTVDLLSFWLPMFIFSSLSLKSISSNLMSNKWSGIQEVSVMPFLFVPILKETLGFSLTQFKVTDKSGKKRTSKFGVKDRMPYYVLLAMSLVGIIRVIYVMAAEYFAIGLFVVLFWIIRNGYYLIMGMFMMDGRDSSDEGCIVADSADAVLKRNSEVIIEGITTQLSERGIKMILDDPECVERGDVVDVVVNTEKYEAGFKGVIVMKMFPKSRADICVATVEALDFGESWEEYLQIIYDRIPTLPQNLDKDAGFLTDLLRNLGARLAKL